MALVRIPRKIARNRKLLVFALAVTFIVALAVWWSFGRNSAYKGTGHPDLKPFSWSSGGSLVGAGPDLARLVFSELGLPLKLEVSSSWGSALSDVAQGKADFLVAVRQTTPRTNDYLYSDSYAVDPIAIFVKKDKTFSYMKWEDLVGRKGASVKDNSFDDQFDAFMDSKLTISYVGDEAAGFAELASGDADYFLDSYYSGSNFIKAKDTEGQFVSMKPYVVSENIYFAIYKQSALASYLPKINSAIAKYKLNGKIDSLLRSNRETLMMEALEK